MTKLTRKEMKLLRKYDGIENNNEYYKTMDIFMKTRRHLNRKRIKRKHQNT